MKLVVAFVVGWSSFAFAQAKAPIKVVSPPIKGPAPEVAPPITVPPIPTFAIVSSPNGFRTVHELRVAGRKLIGTKIQVEGNITWIYDCASAVKKKGESKAQTQRRIDADPTICERPKFYLGDAKSTSPEQSLWIVDVPRAPNKLERERLPKDELARWPKPPTLALGQRVVVTGTFDLASPHSERNSDGLLVFESIAPASPSAAAPTQSPPPDPPKATPLSRKKVDRPPRQVTDSAESIRISNQGTRAYGQKNYDEAIAKYTDAISRWGGNHVAYYGLAGAYIGKNDWAAARDAMDNAVSLEPTQPMYLMTYGLAIYESIVAAERQALAKRQGVDPSLVVVDNTTLNFSKAIDPLVAAVAIEPTIWRAHYYIGRIYRDQGFAAAAATELREAVANGATAPGPYIALGELYRKWDFPKDASEIALLGTARFTGSEGSDVWYVLGMSYDDQGDNKLAIQAFTQALAARPDNAKALFQRGQAYFRLKDKKRAKADLEAYLKAVDGSTLPDFVRQQANKMLMDLGAR
jgi:tetratricopeptide (TPR) repeat protein